MKFTQNLRRLSLMVREKRFIPCAHNIPTCIIKMLLLAILKVKGFDDK